MNISILDATTLGVDIDLSIFNKFGNVSVYGMTAPSELKCRIEFADVIIVNKIKLNGTNLNNCKNLKLICVAATGYDNIDVDYCRKNNIAVCNVVGYSTNCVAQVTVSMALSLLNHLSEYDKCVKDGSYTSGGVQNRLTPVYHEIQGKTWGIVGAGNIGCRVAQIAECLGCKVIAFKRNKTGSIKCVDLKELMANSDIISLHLPLNKQTENIIDRDMLSLMKKDAIIINTSRGKIWDEQAVSECILNGSISGMGSDVYSLEPMSCDHPFNKILGFDNVCLTPHMAWGSYESRKRCVDEIVNNIEMFLLDKIHNRVDIKEI